jgi:hypothetical protein
VEQASKSFLENRATSVDSVTERGGLRPQPLSVLRKAGVQEQPGGLQIVATLDEAIAAAVAHLARPMRSS